MKPTSKHKFFGVLVIVVLFVLVVVVVHRPDTDKTGQLTWKNWSQIQTPEQCEELGGRWGVWSFWQGGEPGCDMPFPDAGKICTDKEDCMGGLCVYDAENPLEGYAAKGICAARISVSCVMHHYFIEDGKVVEKRCVE